jgi:G3E family GTPase
MSINIKNENSDGSTSRAKDGKKAVSVFIITGFLGSGKTTVLNSLLNQFEERNNFIIENEIGQVNIDKKLVSGNIEKVFEITNGCLCCNLDTELYDALDQIARMEHKPDNLFIETTGIADAGNLSAIFREDFVREVFDLKKIICMVDVEVIEDFLAKTPEAGRQIVASDLVVLNKTDAILPQYLEKVLDVVKRLNPYAHNVLSPDGYLDKQTLQQPNVSRPMFSLDIAKPSDDPHDITTVLYETKGAFDIEKLEILLRTSLYIYYRDVYRIKGYVRNSKGEVYLLQSAGKTLSIIPTDESTETSYLVFIGRKLTREIAKRLLHSAEVS